MTLPRPVLRVWPSLITIALSSSALAGWMLLRSGKQGWSRFLVLWIICYGGVVVFGIAAATVFSWLQPLLRRRDIAPPADEGAMRAKFEETVMAVIVSVGLFAVLTILVRSH